MEYPFIKTDNQENIIIKVQNDADDLIERDAKIYNVLMQHTAALSEINRKLDTLLATSKTTSATQRSIDTQTLYEKQQESESCQEIVGSNVLIGGVSLKVAKLGPLMRVADHFPVKGTLRDDEMKRVWLCYNNCDVEINGEYPIHRAVVDDNLQAVKQQCFVLKQKKVDVDLVNCDDNTPLHLAIIHNVQPEIVYELLKHGASLHKPDGVENNAFHLAVEHDHVQIFDYCGDDEPALNSRNRDGNTPLIMCAVKNSSHLVERLLQCGAKVDERDRNSGRTALFHAVENDSERMVELLLRHGADTRVVTFAGYSIRDVINELQVSDGIKALINADIGAGGGKRRPKRSKNKP